MVAAGGFAHEFIARIMAETTPTPAPETQQTAESKIAGMFSPRQRRTLGFSITLFATAVSAVLLIAILMLVNQLLGVFSGVLWPVAIAGVLALILRPAVGVLERVFKGRRLLAVIILYALFIILITALLIMLLPPLASQLLDLIAYVPELGKNITAYVQTHWPDWLSLAERLYENPTIASVLNNLRDELSKLPSLVLPSLKAVSAGVFSTISFTIHFAVLPIYLFFFLLSRSEPTAKLAEQLPFLKPGLREDIVFLVNEFIAIIVSFFRGQLTIALIMGVMLAIGFWAFGLQFGVLIGLALGILNIIPYLGTITGILITLPLAFFQPDGGMVLIFKLAIVYVVVQLIESWLLTPKIMGDRTGLHPAVIIFAIFFWGTALGGIMGMLLAIPFTAFFVTFWRLLKRKYFRQSQPVAEAKN
ncbi:putative PurR-regulated permease PerM [Ereboglobus sp. PH5-5]|uniref:AI-2E family transporter n=1 Tax=unclassified Ereboglobus TaxID=2626932 RepID=UPI002404D9AD|nr:MULTISPECIES: AI-2E family transporter [unclassified Ereboglobus]MDF9827018.1 putative PurR-regulated permease PerM [Ereboglobus sp. PH5-10]MDF9832040.1 putative PurR-regulated permease PerM [Ereboglobus sp. PH5-5]